MLDSRVASFFFVTTFLGLSCAVPGGQESFTMGRASALRSQDSCSSQLICYDLEAPLDHQKPQGKTIKVKFAVHKARKTQKGALLLAFGGPGDSGISGLQKWLPTFDTTLLDEFDLVTFDLRGAHRSGALDCPLAYHDYLFTPARAKTSEDRETLAAAAKEFAKKCPKEMGQSLGDLRFYNSEQAAQDLELIRQQLGYETWTIHAMSYGTQLAQEYAARYPKQVKALVLDGAVDLTFGLLQWERDLAEAHNAVLLRSFRACSGDPACRKLFERTKPSEAFRKIRQRLSREGEIFVDEKSLTLYDFEYTAGLSMGRPASRSAFLRSLAAAADGDFSPLVKLAYGDEANAGKSEDAAENSPAEASFSGMSSGIYYAFICNDYRLSAESLDERITAFFSNAEAYEKSGLRIRNALYSEIACAAWPTRPKPAADRPPFSAEGIPVIVINSKADANVPAKYGYSLAKDLMNAALIEVDGGKHIMYGYKKDCIDSPVTQFLHTAALPEARHIKCKDRWIDPMD